MSRAASIASIASAARVGVVVGAIALVAGCQLLLPSEDGDGTGARGGAASSTSGDSSSSGKTSSSSSKASTTGSSMSSTHSSTSSSSGSTNASTTGSGVVECQPSQTACNGITTLALPKLCPKQVTCTGNLACTQYCSAIESLCPGQYPNNQTCCQACEFLETGSEGAQCCHVGALNDLAADMAGASACTIAGPFGSDTLDAGSTCGSQIDNLCKIYETVCPVQQATCNKSACIAHFDQNNPVDDYKVNQNSDPLSKTMDALLGGGATACATVAMNLCPSMVGP